MIGLFRKELEELSGLLVFAVFAVLWVGWAHTTVPLHLRSGEEVVRYLIEDLVILGCLGAFAAGHSRFGPEFQQGSIAFLDGLPTSRARVFAVKVVAGALPGVVITLGLTAIKLAALSAHPLSNAVNPLAVALLVGVVAGLLITAHYTTGLVLSWFGEVGWQALLVSAVCLLITTELVPAAAPYYPLFQGAVRVVVQDGWPTAPLVPAVLWALWSAGAFALSGVLFLGPGDRIASGPWWVRGIAQVLVYTPPALVLLLAVLGSSLASAVSLPSMFRSTWRADTEHFRILATEAERAAAEALIAQAEDVRSRVEARFGAPGPERLDLELTGASEHLGGVFVHGKLQLRPDADPATLAHELSHAWSHELGSPQGESAWRFFEEGLASHNQGVAGASDSQAAAPSLGSPASDWWLAAVQGRRSAQFSPDEDYAVGRAWTEAIVAVGGEAAPTCVIRAAAARPRDEVDAVPWWWSLLNDCDLDFAEVIAAYEAALPLTPPFPEMIAWYDGTRGGAHHIRFTPPPNEARQVVCMARADVDASRTVYGFDVVMPQAESCSFGAQQVDPRGFDLIVGWVDDRGAHHLGEWRRIHGGP